MIIADTVKGRGVARMELSLDWHVGNLVGADYDDVMPELQAGLQPAPWRRPRDPGPERDLPRRHRRLRPTGSPETVQGIPGEEHPGLRRRRGACDDSPTTDPRIVVLAADLASANRTVDFQRRHPDRFVNVGIAEKNMVTVAAGMAACGLIPYAATFASFAALLCCEQIRTDCAYPGLPVRVIGHHSGMSMGFYGTSHHALEDLGIMRIDRRPHRGLRHRLQPPACAAPRFGRPPGCDVHPARSRSGPRGLPGSAAADHRRSHPVARRHDLTLIATGSQVRPALDAAELLAAGGIGTRVLDMHTIKPLDRAARDRGGAGDRRRSSPSRSTTSPAGWGRRSPRSSARPAIAVPFRRHGIADEHVLIGPPKPCTTTTGSTPLGIAETARAFLARKQRRTHERGHPVGTDP